MTPATPTPAEDQLANTILDILAAALEKQNSELLALLAPLEARVAALEARLAQLETRVRGAASEAP